MKQKAVFLDRDGILNNEESNYYIYREEDFFLNKGIGEALKILQEHGYIFIVITNQGGISKGFYTTEDVLKVHKKLKFLLAKYGVSLHEIYYCPHHDDNENCLCRKPKALSIQKALSRFNIDPGKSWMIGDRDTDITAGKKAGLKTLKVKANSDMSFLADRILKGDI